MAASRSRSRCATRRAKLDDGQPSERPLGLSTFTLDAEWVADDAPMLLWVLEYIEHPEQQRLLRQDVQLSAVPQHAAPGADCALPQDVVLRDRLVVVGQQLIDNVLA